MTSTLTEALRAQARREAVAAYISHQARLARERGQGRHIPETRKQAQQAEAGAAACEMRHHQLIAANTAAGREPHQWVHPGQPTPNPAWWEAAIAGLCSHGGHGPDGDTCSDAPDECVICVPGQCPGPDCVGWQGATS
jgi:hypothetical protein